MKTQPFRLSAASIIFLTSCIAAPCLAAPAKGMDAQASPPVLSHSPIEQQFVLEAETRREAEHRAAIAEAKADLVSAANSRLENWIGLYGILITIIFAAAGFFTWRSAANAARAEVQDMRDALDKIESQAEKAMARINQIEGDIAEKQKSVTDHHDRIQEMANALPGQTPRDALSQEDKESLASATQSIEALPAQKWSANEFRVVLFAVEEEENWPRYVELAEQMGATYGDSSDDLAFALFAKAFGLEKMGEHDQASAAYQDYLDRCLDDDNENRAGALSNWGNALSFAARTKAAAGDLATANHNWKLAGEKFAASLAEDSDQHEALHNWGFALIGQASHMKGAEREQMLADAEKCLTKANLRAPGSGSYNLACAAALRGDAVGAANWLRDAKAKNLNLPDCEYIATDTDLDTVRDSPEFRQALLEIGCPNKTHRKSA